mgnify:FL=1|jgi:type IV pilus assembly protein PilM
MARKVVGLDIDYSGIKVAEVVRKGRAKMVTKIGSVSLPAGTVVDGKVTDVQTLSHGLERLLLEQEISARSAVLGLRSTWVTVKTHRLPKMPKKELDKALEFEVPELVSFPVHSPQDVSYDYFVNTESDKEVEIVLVACPRQHLNPYIDAIRAAGLTLEAIDLPALNWAELLNGETRRAFVEISEEQTTIQVALGGVFKVLRVVPVGTKHFREGVQEAFECGSDEARNLCANRSLDFLLMEGPGSKRVIRATVQQFVGSVLQTLDFVRAQERATRFSTMLDEVVLLGDLADLSGLTAMLAEEVDLPVRSLKQMENFHANFDFMRPSQFSGYGSALAMGWRGVDE